MKQNRLVTLDNIIESEGSELNLGPTEPGGASRYGVSVSFMTDYWCRPKGLAPATIQTITDLTEDEARKIYDEVIFDHLRFDDFPSGPDYVFANYTVNLGIHGGPGLLQIALGIWPETDVVDDATLKATNAINPESLIWALSAAWLSKKKQDSHWFPFPGNTRGYGHGWTNRANNTRNKALSLMKGTV